MRRPGMIARWRTPAGKAPSPFKISWASARVTNQRAFGWHPPHLVGLKSFDPFPLKAAPPMMQPHDASDVRQEHPWKLAICEGVADHHDRLPWLAGRIHSVRHHGGHALGQLLDLCVLRQSQSLGAFDDVVLDAEQPREIPPSRFVTGPSAEWRSTRQSGCESASTIALNPASAPRGVQCVSCR